MQRFIRPPEPKEFQEDVKKYRDAIEEYFELKDRVVKSAEDFNEKWGNFQKELDEYPTLEPSLTKEARDAFAKRSRDHKKDADELDALKESLSKSQFEAKWSKYKSNFAKMQRGKCGYCEIKVLSGQDGDVEHFFPKSEVWELKDDPNTWGKELANSSRVVGREINKVSEQGYWWMAYDWNNYLLSCQVCNQKWKRAYFPVGKPRNTPPSKIKPDDVLLLNPFDPTLDPKRHFEFDVMGQITSKKGCIYGFETIRTCGLDREGLRDSRFTPADWVYRLVNRFKTTKNKEVKIVTLNDIRFLGRKRNPHCGMIRAIFEDLSGKKWGDITKILRKELRK